MPFYYVQSLLLLLMSTTSLTHGEEVFTTQESEDVVNFVESLRQCRGVVGLTVGVLQGNDTWTRGFGLADRESSREVSSTDLFCIGSLTKAFTTALLSLYLNKTNRYSWDTPVADIMGPDFRFVTDQLTRQITLKDILGHRTGLENNDIPLFAGSKLTNAQYARNIRYLPVEKLFRNDYNYNNWMYGLAGNVAEVLGGAPWVDLVQTRLLRHLNMTQTKMVIAEALAENDPNMATPYVMLGGETVRHYYADAYSITPKDAAGSMASSADDMIKWMKMLLNNGRTPDGRQLISERRLKEITSPYIPIQTSRRARWNLLKPEFPEAYVTDAYGLAWFIATYRGYQMMWHSGNLWAYTSYVAYVPGLDLGVFVANNGPSGKNASHILRETFFYIVDVVLGKEPWLNVSNACYYPDLWRPSTSSSGDTSNAPACADYGFTDLDHYAGLYLHPLYGDVDVVRNGSRGLYVRYGFLEGRLCRTDAQDMARFEVVGKMAFEYRPGSGITYLQLNFTQPLSTGTYREVILTIPPSRSKVLTFHRETQPPSSGASGREDADGGFRAVVSLLLVTGLSLYLS